MSWCWALRAPCAEEPLQDGHRAGAWPRRDRRARAAGIRARPRRDQAEALGALNGEPFATATSPYRGALYVGVPKAVREAAGVGVGDEVELELELDTRPRVLELAPELEVALAAEPELRARFDALSFSRKRELAEPVADAKKPETRAVRVDKAIGRLRELD